jgi:hypothetical protein
MRDKEWVEPAVDIFIDDLEEVQKQGYQTLRDQKERALLLPLLRSPLMLLTLTLFALRRASKVPRFGSMQDHDAQEHRVHFQEQAQMEHHLSRWSRSLRALHLLRGATDSGG